LDTKASTLSGKVEWLENEVNSLASTASGLLKSIGVMDITSQKPASAMEMGHSGHSHGKLNSRVASLEESTRSVQEKTNLLETELFGTTTESTIGSGKNEGHSFKRKIEALATQADELKSRLSAMQSTPLLGDVAKLVEKTENLGSNAARLFASIGIENITATKPLSSSSDGMKARLSSLEGYAEAMQWPHRGGSQRREPQNNFSEIS
jgi:outer membrane murein-binding lipoprotein Lpp